MVTLRYFFTFCILLAPLAASHADVWEVESEWTDEWESKYQTFVKDEVTPEIFVNSKSSYYGLRLDCADLAYGGRILFAAANKLPFAMNNPTGNRVNPLWTEKMSRWDSVKDPMKRVKQFVHYVAESVGTENLARIDSFPLKISSIDSGDFYMFKRGSGDGLVRHTYFIKQVDEFGNFDLLFSTQLKKKENAALGFKKGQTLYNRPVGNSPNWGFRRFKSPSEFGNDTVKSNPNYSLEQYEFADKFTTDSKFFRYVQKLLRVNSENPAELVQRRLNDLCSQSNDRIEAVSNGAIYLKEHPECMNYTNYDIYSTPSRDGRLKSAFQLLQEDIEILKEQNIFETEVPQDSRDIIAGIFEKDHDASFDQKVYDSCPVDIVKAGTELPEVVTRKLEEVTITRRIPGSISLREIYQAQSESKMSFHPNDNLYRRWGFTVGKKTTCETFYD